jgi:hypothetical protein
MQFPSHSPRKAQQEVLRLNSTHEPDGHFLPPESLQSSISYRFLEPSTTTFCNEMTIVSC